jgi:hypothetical protein
VIQSGYAWTAGRVTMSLQMLFEIHALMQDASYLDPIGNDAKKDHMRSD